MSKRNKLKSLIKECLVEILNEGLLITENTLNESKRHAIQENSRTRRSEVLDKITYDHLNNSRNEINTKPTHDVSQITSDPTLQQMLAETANSTRFREQSTAEGKGGRHYTPVDAASRVMYDADPTQIFDGSDKWAALAFSSKVK